MNKVQAIKAAREEANAIIDQMTRIARGWDKGQWRDDMPRERRTRTNTIARDMHDSSEYAFQLSAQFAEVV